MQGVAQARSLAQCLAHGDRADLEPGRHSPASAPHFSMPPTPFHQRDCFKDFARKLRGLLAHFLLAVSDKPQEWPRLRGLSSGGFVSSWRVSEQRAAVRPPCILRHASESWGQAQEQQQGGFCDLE